MPRRPVAGRGPRTRAARHNPAVSPLIVRPSGCVSYPRPGFRSWITPASSSLPYLAKLAAGRTGKSAVPLADHQARPAALAAVHGRRHLGSMTPKSPKNAATIRNRASTNSRPRSRRQARPRARFQPLSSRSRSRRSACRCWRAAPGLQMHVRRQRPSGLPAGRAGQASRSAVHPLDRLSFRTRAPAGLRRHAAWASRSTCRGPAGRGSARPVSGRCRARGRRAAGRGQPRSRTR